MDTLTQAETELDQLILKFHSHTLSEEEKVQLEEALRSSQEARHIFHDLNTLEGAYRALRIDRQERYRLRTEKVTVKRRWLSLRNVAATVALLVVVGCAAVLISGRLAEAGWNEVTCVNAKVTDITLPDGSTVHLYSGSTLRYPSAFRTRKRNVYLQGEATFEVKSDSRSPFFVHTGEDMSVKAYGTKFNVCAYDNEPDIYVYLTHGAVDFSSPFLAEPVIMKPELRLIYNKTSHKTDLVHQSPDEYAAREKGILLFRKTPLSEIILKLQRAYDARIEVADREILSYVYTGQFYDESLQQIMDILVRSSPQIKLTKTDEHYILSRK